MKTTKKIEITIYVDLEIDTDKAGYEIHGGEETPEDIADKAVDFYVQETDYGVDSTHESITVLKSELVNCCDRENLD